MRTLKRTGAGALLLAWALAAAAQQPIAYPAKGQSQARQEKDEGECHVWAKNKSGVDPAALAANPPAQETSSTGGGERARGAARGALGGAAVGAIAGDAGKGAAIGAVGGTAVGGHRARQNRDARNASAQQAHAGKLDSYNRAYASCMSGRGYTMG
jgi:hypothetical protein